MPQVLWVVTGDSKMTKTKPSLILKEFTLELKLFLPSPEDKSLIGIGWADSYPFIKDLIFDFSSHLNSGATTSRRLLHSLKDMFMYYLGVRVEG